MKTPSQPDYSQQINTQNELTDRQMDLADRQYADTKALTDQFTPMFQQQAQLSIDGQTKSNERSDTQWENYTSNFMPLESDFAQKAKDFGSVDRQEQNASSAIAGVQEQYGLARQQQSEQLAASGEMPGGGASLALQNSTNLSEAKAAAAAGDAARRQTEAQGLSLENSAIGIGRGQVATGLQASDLALRQGGAAQGSASGAVGLAGAPAAGASQIYGNASAANQGAVGIMNTGFQNGLASTSANNAIFGDVLKAGGMAAGFFSSKKLKKMGGKVPDKKALGLIHASPSRHWAYKPGLGDGSTQPRMGPTAESLKGSPVSDGKKVDAISMLGLHHAGIGAVDKKVEQLTRKVAALERRAPSKGGGKSLGLSDARRA